MVYEDEDEPWNPKEWEKKMRMSGFTLFGPVECAKCKREAIPLGPDTYPCRCPVCGTRWHEVLSRKESMESLSNVEIQG